MRGRTLAVLGLLLGFHLGEGQALSIFSQKVEKGGGTSVFNTAKRVAESQKTDQSEKSKTLVGEGAKDEPMVAENDTTLDLFCFHNNLTSHPGPAPTAQSLPFSVSWKNGKTTIKSEKAELTLSNRLQLRLTDVGPEGGKNVPSFRIRRMKTKLEGWVYTQNLGYELQLNWAADKPLEDANVRYDFSQGQKRLVLKAGQFKVPFGRQELTSSGSQQFVDRSVVSTTFAKGRDIGVELSGLAWGGKLDWRLGAFNGAGPNATANDNGKMQVDARLTFQPLGEVPYAESDLKASPEPRFAFAIQFESNDRRGTAANAKQETWGADAVLLWRGFSLVVEGFHGRREPVAASASIARGLAAQAGYFLVPGTWELAARYAVLDPSHHARSDQLTEKGVALNYFMNQHSHKLQADIRRLQDHRLRKRSWELRLQYQLIF